MAQKAGVSIPIYFNGEGDREIINHLFSLGPKPKQIFLRKAVRKYYQANVKKPPTGTPVQKLLKETQSIKGALEELKSLLKAKPTTTTTIQLQQKKDDDGLDDFFREEWEKSRA